MDLFEKCGRYDKAKELRRLGIYPYFIPIEGSHGQEVVVEGRKLMMVGSNNYLGLTHHPEVTGAATRAVRKYGSGCTGSRFLNGTLDLHVELERRLAQFTRRQQAITFSTGFQVNLGAISSLAERGDYILCDRENHASIFDGCRLSYATVRKYRHNDMEDLERQFQSIPETAGKLVVTDGVFSMKGDLAELPEIVRLSEKYGARILLDDAHGIGVLGENGRGTAEHFGVESEIDLIVGTFSKSFASLGGFVAGDAEIIEFVKHRSRSLIFSASITPASAATALAALGIIENEPGRRKQLWRNVTRMQKAFTQMGYDVSESRSPIIAIRTGGDAETFGFWQALIREGVFTNPVISPAVPPGEGLIRTSYMATHTDEDLDRVLDVFRRLGVDAGLLKVA